MVCLVAGLNIYQTLTMLQWIVASNKRSGTQLKVSHAYSDTQVDCLVRRCPFVCPVQCIKIHSKTHSYWEYVYKGMVLCIPVSRFQFVSKQET